MAGKGRWARLLTNASLLILVGTAVGCGSGRPPRVIPPPLDPSAVAAAAIATADTDGDSELGVGELGESPAIASVLVAADVNRDKKLTIAELRSWLTAVRDSRVAITSCSCAVTQRGRPLKDVTVRLMPCSFMSRETMSAEGVTNAAGFAKLTISNSPYSGVHCGLYRVEIEGVGIDGKLVSSRYNTASTLGLAVGGTLPEHGRAVFAIE